MFDEVVKKSYKPSSGGWDRLSKKIEVSDQEDLEEAKMWRGITAAIIVGFLVLPLFQFLDFNSSSLEYSEPQLGEVIVAGGSAVEVPQSVKGVRLYHLFIDKAAAQAKTE